MNSSENMTLKGTMEIKSNASRRRSLTERMAIAARWILIAAMILSPWAFGSVHHWAQRGIAICLLIGLALYWFETALDSENKKILPYVSVFVVAGILLGFFQLWSSPASIVQWVTGRQAEIFQSFTGEPPASPRISINPEETWGQLRLLIIGLAGLLLGCRYFRSSKDLVLLLTVGTANGVLISFFGILQKLTWQGQMFWAYPIERGIPFGPFINRNNGAGFLLMSLACCIGLIPIVMSKQKNPGPVPIISKEMPFWRQLHSYFIYFISELTATKLAVLLCAGVIGAGVVASLSRGGVSAMLIGAVTTILFFGMARRPKSMMLVVIPVVLIATSLAVWLSFSEQLLRRFEQSDLIATAESNLRIKNWTETWPAVSEMGLLGSGLGSYRQIHRLYSKGPELKLYEHAENQFFQALVEAGWLGLVLFCLAWLFVFWYAVHLLYRGQSQNSIGVGTFGIFLLASQVPASVADFGLYVPANALQLSILVGLLACHAHRHSRRMKKSGWLQFEASNWVAQATLLILFACLTIATLDYHRRSKLDVAMVPKVGRFEKSTLNLSQTEAKIQTISHMLQRCSSVEGLNYLGELWIHRARLMYLESIKSQDEFLNAVVLLDQEERANLMKNAWAMTDIQQMQENADYLRRNVSRYQSARFVNSPFITENLPRARHFFNHSRRLVPLQPVVHIRLGQLAGAMDQHELGNPEMEDAIALAPNNPDYRMFVAVYYLQQGNPTSAAIHLKRYLTLQPEAFSSVHSLLTGQSGRRIEPVTPEIIFEQIIPDNSKMLFQFAKTMGDSKSEIKSRVLEHADQLLGEKMPAQRDKVLLRAAIRLAKGDTDLAIEAFRAALKYNPMDKKNQFRLAKLLYDQERLDEAMQEAKKLLRFDRRNPTYNSLIEEIEKKLEQADSFQK